MDEKKAEDFCELYVNRIRGLVERNGVMSEEEAVGFYQALVVVAVASFAAMNGIRGGDDFEERCSSIANAAHQGMIACLEEKEVGANEAP